MWLMKMATIASNLGSLGLGLSNSTLTKAGECVGNLSNFSPVLLLTCGSQRSLQVKNQSTGDRLANTEAQDNKTHNAPRRSLLILLPLFLMHLKELRLFLRERVKGVRLETSPRRPASVRQWITSTRSQLNSLLWHRTNRRLP